MKKAAITFISRGIITAHRKRGLAMVMCLLMLVGIMPTQAWALVNSGETISAVTAPAHSKYTVSTGTDLADVGLPGELTVTVSTPSAEEGGDADTRTEDVPVEWTGTYDKNTAGNYILTAKFTGSYSFDGEMPSVNVTVADVAAAPAPQGGPMHLSVGTLNIGVTNASAAAVDLNSLVLTDLENGIVTVSIPINQGTTTPTTIEIGIPDFYSFVGASGSGTNYTSAATSTNTATNANAVDNRLTVEIPAPTDQSQQQTIKLSFNIKLNRNSIDATDEAAWLGGTWSPNADNCNFTIMEQGEAGSLVSTTANIVKAPSAPPLLTMNREGLFEETSYFTEHGASATEHLTWVAITWSHPDLYSVGPDKLKEFTLTIPENWEIISLNSRNMESAGYRNMIGSTDLDLTNGGRNAKLTISDDGSDPTKTRMLLLDFKADDAYSKNGSVPKSM